MKQQGEGDTIYHNDKKVWSLTKDYDAVSYENNITSLGYKISVYQESINQTIPEYLVNFDFLVETMSNYGFRLLPRDDAKKIGLPEGSGLFIEMYNKMMDEIRKYPKTEKEYGMAPNMMEYEKKISFLNRYFVFQKIATRNVEKLTKSILEHLPNEIEFEEKHTASAQKVVEKVDKQLRQQGKVAELALGYQGAVGALCKMGADRFLSKPEMQKIVKLWRKTNPAIVALWAEVGSCVISAISLSAKTELKSKLVSFYCDDKHLIITLPSGRELYYVQPQIIHEIIKYNIYYKGLDDKKKWGLIDTYGGKLVENIVQAIARDALVAAMHRLDENGFDIALHVHDEIVAQIPIKNAENRLNEMIKLMSAPLPWAPGLILTAEGYLTSFYKKD